VNTTREELRRRRQRLGWMGRAIVVEAFAAPQVVACSHFVTVTIGAK
jgi:hypothetical protein